MVWMIFTFLFRDWCCDSLPRPWGSTSGLCCVLANGQSSCEGSQAPHGSDRRFLRDECQSSSSHGVRGNLDLHLSLPIPSGLGVIGGVGSLSTWSPSGRGSGYLGLMYSQAPVRSYTKDRAGLQGDHTPKGGGYKVMNRNSSCGNLCRPHWTQVVAYRCLSVFCGGKGTAPGCAPGGSPKVPSGWDQLCAWLTGNPKFRSQLAGHKQALRDQMGYSQEDSDPRNKARRTVPPPGEGSSSSAAGSSCHVRPPPPPPPYGWWQ